ncbi:MAG: sensor histidine kinase [Thiomargarita sp.]|nr:sensor histidine kinase [Thiomargarita sp.]
MNYKLLSIKNILLVFVLTIIFIIIFSTIIQIDKQYKMQYELARTKLEQITTKFVAKMDQNIELAIQNVHRLKEHSSILLDKKFNKLNKYNTFLLKNLMAENLHFKNLYYSHYIALESSFAKQLFKKPGWLLLVHKKDKWFKTDKYNKPKNMKKILHYDPSYSNDPSDPKKSWYYVGKQHRDVQITPIYFDEYYTKKFIISISQGLYKNLDFKGVVGISLSLDTLLEEIENKNINQTGGLFLANNHRGLLLSKITALNSQKSLFLNAPKRQSVNLYTDKLQLSFWESILNKNIPYQEIKNIDGEIYSISSKKLEHLPWTLVSYQKTSELKQAKLFNNSFFIMSTIIVLILLILMIWVLFKLLIIPISNLLKSVHKIKAPKELPIETSVVEIYYLTKIFSRMVMNTIRRNNEKLEYVRRLEIAQVIQTKQIQQTKRYHEELSKIKRDSQLTAGKLKKSNSQIQKVRVEMQKYKLETKRAQMKSQLATRVKTQFLENMNHELRTPMNAVIGYTEMLQEDAKERGDQELVSDLQKIHGASYHLLDLIGNLFDMSKIESSKMDLYIDTFDITPLVQDIATTITSLLEKQSNTLKVNCDNVLGTMTNDVTKVRQNLLNLLTNANKFSQQSVIVLTVMRKKIDNIDWIIFEVADQGIGMPEEQISKLFRAFVSVGSSVHRTGSGLGLAITKQFCQIMGGDIVVSSELGKGSIFSMRLPAHIEPID